jgi:4-hydroxy-tetrahydrodipicolinate synthase
VCESHVGARRCGQLDVLAGENHRIFTTLCQAGSGAIATSAHLHLHCFVAVYEELLSVVV